MCLLSCHNASFKPHLHLYIIAICCNECLMCSERVCFLVVSVNQEKADWEQRKLFETWALLEASEKFLLWCWKLPVRPLQKGCTWLLKLKLLHVILYFVAFYFASCQVGVVGNAPATQTTGLVQTTCKCWSSGHLTCFKMSTCTTGTLYSKQESHSWSVNTHTHIDITGLTLISQVKCKTKPKSRDF